MTKELSESARKAKAALAATTPGAKTLTNADFLSTSVTPINLACANRVFGGLAKGSIYRLIGKSQSSKTFVSGGILCEAAISPYFKDYELQYDDVERGMRMDCAKFWRPLVSRLRAPNYDGDGNTLYSTSLSEMYDDVLAQLAGGKRFVRVVDSLDALSEPNAESKMTDGRAKANSQKMRKLMDGLAQTGSILILVQHAKVNLGNTWAELVTTGGSSPEYYSTLDIWLSKCETIKVELNTAKRVKAETVDSDVDDGADEKKKLPIGVMFQAHVKKNRTNGVDRIVRFPLYYDYGIDDRAACVNYLLEFGHWSKLKGVITAPELNFEGKYRQLIEHIEAGNKLQELRVLTGKVWREIEAAISQNPKPRYT